MKHLLAFIIAPTATTAIAAITCGVIFASPAAVIGAAMIFGFYIFLYTILLGVPGHLVLWLLKIKSRLAYAAYGLLSGSAAIPILAGCASGRKSFTEDVLIMMILTGFLGMVNATIFAVTFRKLSAEVTDDKPVTLPS